MSAPNRLADDEIASLQVSPISILGIKIRPVTVEQLHDYIADIIHSQNKSIIPHVNIHALNLAYSQNEVGEFLNMRDLVFCDGAGVRLGGKILGYNIPSRITYADWMWQLGEFAQDNNFSFFFLGGKPGITEKAISALKDCYPDLRIVGFHHGYFDKCVTSNENNDVVKLINKAQPNILIVGFGMPLQELWLKENWQQVNANVMLTGGAVFDYISGELQRAPKWMTDNGFEWLGRLLIEPRRLWRRYVIGNPIFFWRVLKQKFGLLKFRDIS